MGCRLREEGRGGRRRGGRGRKKMQVDGGKRGGELLPRGRLTGNWRLVVGEMGGEAWGLLLLIGAWDVGEGSKNKQEEEGAEEATL